MTTGLKFKPALLTFLWCLLLFHPFRFLNSIAGGVSVFYKVATVLLYIYFIIFLFSEGKKVNFPEIMILFLLHVFSTLLIAENTGYARAVTRIIMEVYFLALITFFYFRDENYLKTMFTLFVYTFLYFGVFGIIGKGLVPWDYALSDENQYGIYMVMGFFFTLFYTFGQTQKKKRLLGIVTCCVCVSGIVVSFSRGAFFAFIVCFFLFWLQSKRKIASAVLFLTFGVIILISSSLFFSKNEFWNEMATITQGTSESTALDRVILWEIAWEEFKDNPIFGVGPHNFGVRAPEYTTENTIIRYPNFRTLWGRSLHNIYLQTLSEQGIVGVILFIVIIRNFWNKNGYIRQMLAEIREISLPQREKYNLGDSQVDQYNSYSYSILFASIGYMIGGFFYPIYEYEWFWHQLILNMLFFLVVSDKQVILKKHLEAPPA